MAPAKKRTTWSNVHFTLLRVAEEDFFKKLPFLSHHFFAFFLERTIL